MTDDVVGSQIGDGAGGNAVGKEINHQQVTVNLPHPPVPPGAVPAAPAREESELQTIRLIYQLVAGLDEKLDRERQERMREMVTMREELAQIRSLVSGTNEAVQATPKLPTNHRALFVLAFLFLALPVPFFYSQVRDLVGVAWQAALGLAFVSYAVSAALWSQFWWTR